MAGLLGIAKANAVIQEVPLVKDGSETGIVGQAAIAEARFLRGVYHFELAKLWRNVPYASDTATYQAGNYDLPNQSGGVLTPIWDKIEADFAAAMAALPITQTEANRANSYAAEAFLAKAYLYDHQYAKALPLLTDCISNGITADGQKYGLDIFENNFNAATRNGQESIFAVQILANNGSGSQNNNTDVVLNYPGSGFTGCCGVDVPSYSLVNAFKTNNLGYPEIAPDPATGLPFYDDVNLINDHGVPATAAFSPTTETIDARLDWTVGRRGIPFLDWGVCGGESWTSGNLSPYISKKNAAYRAASQAAYSYSLIRVAALYLWRAECEVELGILSEAEADVNVIRARAANPVNWLSNGSTPLANYRVGLYAGQFTSLGQDDARLFVLNEEQLEFAMEGQRFFDLQRHDGLYGGGAGTGFMGSVLNAYYKADNRIANPALSNANFTAGRDELYPIPSAQINLSGGKLKQNPNY
jgi:starch-binding outer membrane protein, SusD/RagB family